MIQPRIQLATSPDARTLRIPALSGLGCACGGQCGKTSGGCGMGSSSGGNVPPIPYHPALGNLGATFALPAWTQNNPLLTVGVLVVGGLVLGHILHPHLRIATKKSRRYAQGSPFKTILGAGAVAFGAGYLYGKGIV